jgi:molecular chaperone DnaK (HSP70)
MTALGIDFGTTNSVVAAYSQGNIEVLPIDEPPGDWSTLGFDRLLPSVFAVGDENEPLFGWAAKQRTTSKFEAVKRLFAQEEVVEAGGQTFVVEEVAALLFGHIKRASSAVGLNLNRAVVTVPANSRGLARYRTKLCAGMAGIEVPALINEPTAAAMAYASRTASDRTVLVVDWGGGTLDVTVLEMVGGVFMEQVSKGVQRLGGLEFDNRFARAILETVPDSDKWSDAERGSFRLDVERAKILLSSQEETNVKLPSGDYRRVTRKMFEDVAKPLIERARDSIERCLADTKELGTNLDAVILVGGTSKIPAVREFVANIVNLEPALGIDPMLAVAQGAAVASAILAGELETSDFFVSTEHALGTVAVQGRELAFSVLIPRNHKLPAKATDTYFPIADYQDSVIFRVLEGDPEKPLDDDDNVVLKEWEIPIEPPRPVAETAFEVSFEYDVDGILHVSVTDVREQRILLQDDVSFSISKDKKTLVQMANRVSKTLEKNTLGSSKPSRPIDPDVQLILVRARTKVIPFVDDDEAEALRGLVSKLESASADEIGEAKQAVEVALGKYSYLF